MKIQIENKEYKIKKWFENKTDMVMLRADAKIGIKNNLIIEKKTEKAFCLKTESGYTFWIPQSALESTEFIPEKIMVSFFKDVKSGKQNLDNFKNQFSRIFRENGEEVVLKKLNEISI